MFEVPASKRSIKQNRFSFKLAGKTHTLPMLKFAPVAAAEHFENGRQMSGILAAADTDETREALRGLDGDQLMALSEAWAEASGVTPGESGASDD